MSRSVLFPLVVAILFNCQLVRAQEQDAIATVKPSSSKGSSETAATLFHSIDQLLRIADQLERDGHAEEAVRVRAEARELALKENVLARREAELECLQDEVDRLRTLTGDIPTVVVHLVAIEVARSRLGDRAAEFNKLLGIDSAKNKGDAGEPGEGPQAAIPQPGRLIPGGRIQTDSPLFEELKSRKAIAVIAEPTLITTNRRQGSYFSGGTIELPLPATGADGKPIVRTKKYGIEMDVLPTVRAGGKIQLQVKFEQSELKQSERDLTNAPTVAGQKIPSITSRAVNTVFEVQSGQTILMAGLPSRQTAGKPQPGVAGTLQDLAKIVKIAGAAEPTNLKVENALATTVFDADSTELYLLVTPELVNLPAPAPLQPIPAEEEVEILRKALVPNKLAEDIQYFPATPIPRKGTLK